MCLFVNVCLFVCLFGSAYVFVWNMFAVIVPANNVCMCVCVFACLMMFVCVACYVCMYVFACLLVYVLDDVCVFACCLIMFVCVFACCLMMFVCVFACCLMMFVVFRRFRELHRKLLYITL
jgi:hypothetical protein